MQRLILGLVLPPILISLLTCCGCGGGSSSSSFQRASKRKRQNSDEASPAAVAESKVASVPQAKPELAAAVGAAPKGQPPAPPPPVEKAAADAAAAKLRKPVTEIDRRARSIENLTKIGQALQAYVKKYGKLPPQASMQDHQHRFLSWRVLILNDLGHSKLYSRFKTTEPWDSPHNKALLEYIPPEYQSPERLDSKTNYLAIVGEGMALSTENGMRISNVRDGTENTLAVVEVDDQHALEWTRPDELQVIPDQPFDKLGGLRGEGVFGVLASGRVVLLPQNLPPARLAALFTTQGGEPVSGDILDAPSAEALPIKPPVALAKSESPASGPVNVPVATLPASASPASIRVATPEPLAVSKAKPPAWSGAVNYAPDPGKDEVPDDKSLAATRDLLKELYGDEYAQAKSIQQRQQFVKKLLGESEKVKDSAADYYETLRIARDLAATSGDADSAWKACTLIEERFQADPLVMRLKVLEDLHKYAKALASVEPVVKEANRLAREALDSDRFEVAIPAHQVALGLTRMSQRAAKPEMNRLQQQAEALESARSLFHTAQKSLETLHADPNDASANEVVGRYLCFVQNRWDDGLPYLSRAADIRLRGIASLELSGSRSLAQTHSLADQYWELASDLKPPLRRGLHLRALYCYERVMPTLESSLEKVRLQKRIDEAVAHYGREDVDRSLASMRKGEPEKNRK